MTPFDPFIIKALTYLSGALLAYGTALYLLRTRVHEYHARLPPDRKRCLLGIWRRLVTFTRVFLVLLPICFAAVVGLLWAFDSTPVSLTAPLAVLMYLNLVVIHLDRRWHIAALGEETGPETGEEAA
jgi:hypothetical protein